MTRSSGLLVIGVSYHTAPVSVRERLAIPPSQWAADLRALPGVREAVILSTCNRLEVYLAAESPQDVLPPVRDLFIWRSRLDRAAMRPHLYQLTDQRAASHLFRVTAGLDSMVLGESEIAAQVKQAYQSAQAAGDTGPVLNRAFQKALHSAKLIRARTGLGQGSASIGSVVVDLARELFGGRLEGRGVLVWGAGKAADTTARHLLKAGIGNLWIVNRTQAKAEDLALSCRGQWLAWEEALARLAHVDIAVVGTQAPHYVIDRADLETALPARAGRPLALVDLAVPRNIDPSVAGMPGIRLYNIDDLDAIAQGALDQRRAAVAAADQVIREQVIHWQAHADTGQFREAACELVEA